MPYHQFGNLSIYYEVHGEGVPLILIRGLGSNADHWYAQVPAFSKNYKVITFDNRGIARSSDPGGDFSVPMMAKDTLALMDTLGLQRAHVLGLSMGGMIAQELVINHPDRIIGLILVSTHCGGSEQVRPSAEVDDLFQKMVYVADAESKIKAAPTLFDRQTLENFPEIAKRYAEISLKHPVSSVTLVKQWQAVLKHDSFSRLPKITLPTLVLTGSTDLLIPPANSKILADRIPGAELHVVPGGGHQVLVEQPELCNEAILAFLRRVDD